jgi:N-formylglutamate amidohydrolase
VTTPDKPADPVADPILAQLEAGPACLRRPAVQRLPFVFASPHSGRTYPPGFIAASALSPQGLRRSEDAFVDELFEAVPALGCPLIAAEFPRAYVDANRAVSELDTDMFDAPLPLAVDVPGPRVQAGLGVIPRVVRDGVDIYRGKLAADDAVQRLTRLYRPYHLALTGLVEETLARFGCAVVIDCHSMPSVPAVPEMVFGDCHGTSVNPALIRHVERAFAGAGFATARNAPYAGGYTTHLYARRESGVHALQIEINRALYLDEARIEKTAAFAGVKGRITAALRQILCFDISLLRPRRSLAAE